MFDPYYQWLGIPRKQQPPHHYRLLGVEIFEPDLAVIGNASRQRLRFLRTLSASGHGATAQRLIEQVQTARDCLLRVDSKTRYDEWLRERLRIPADCREALTRRILDAQAKWAVPRHGVLGDYEIIERVRRGRFDELYKAVKRASTLLAAIRVLPPSNWIPQEERTRFWRRVSVLQQVNHPNVVRLLSAGTDAGLDYAVLEWIEGETLAEVVRRTGALSEPDAIRWVCQAAAGLAALHERGIVHRHVKPAHLMWDGQTGLVKVIGVGLACFTGQDEVMPAVPGTIEEGRIPGTPDYMAPEQFFGTAPIDQRADIYGLGCTMYRVLTDRRMYDARSMIEKALAHRDFPIPSLHETGRDLSPHVDAIFRRMVAKSGEGRFPSMFDIIEFLSCITR